MIEGGAENRSFSNHISNSTSYLVISLVRESLQLEETKSSHHIKTGRSKKYRGVKASRLRSRFDEPILIGFALNIRRIEQNRQK